MQALVQSQLQLFELFADVCEEAANTWFVVMSSFSFPQPQVPLHK